MPKKRDFGEDCCRTCYTCMHCNTCETGVVVLKKKKRLKPVDIEKFIRSEEKKGE